MWNARTEQPGFFLKVFLLFLPMAAVGTITHEAGHWLAAEWWGEGASLHYGWIGVGDVPPEASPFIILAGPLQTMLTGSGGFVWLWRLKRQEALTPPLSISAWAAVLLTLFWSRPVFNALAALIWRLMGGELSLSGDEFALAAYWHLPEWSLLLSTGMVGFMVCLLVIYWFPAPFRKHLLIAGSSGSLLGFWLWYGVIGPVLLP